MTQGFFEKELSGLKRDLIQMSRTVELNVYEAARALLEARGELAVTVIKRDNLVNAMENAINDRAILLLATRQPVAGDLRFLTACLRLAAELERVGDQAANLSRRALALGEMENPWPLPEKMKEMIAAARGMLELALDSLARDDPSLSKTVLTLDDQVDGLYRAIRAEAIDVMKSDGEKVAWGLELINAASNLERLGDHATNLAEEVIFMVRGLNVRHLPETAAAV
ncbi:phosphate transport system regulatory protein PhoU [Deltaproteobacteria bacterium Smac51]|nr:phosphate transport system regulatory protein PhoU [Deltaproteobacteria bacterium Smac51]